MYIIYHVYMNIYNDLYAKGKKVAIKREKMQIEIRACKKEMPTRLQINVRYYAEEHMTLSSYSVQ